jgi:molybdenum cofactor cytidylyltransferase
MKFGPTVVDNALGKILGHNIADRDGKRILRKGRMITDEDIELLRALGRATVYVAELKTDDVSENVAAERVATATAGKNLRLSAAVTGRVNLYATMSGVLRVNLSVLNKINTLEGITIATLATNKMIVAGKIAATVKILPYALPPSSIISAEKFADSGFPILQVDKILLSRVGLILSGSSSVQDRVVNSFKSSLQRRLNLLEADIVKVSYVPLEDEAGERELALTIRNQIQAGCQLLILAGETAIMDIQDIAPRAVERAGGEVICYGAPVDPGNLLMLAQLGTVPILGAPGCVRSPKTNIVDLVLPRLLAGEQLSRADIVQFGHGGLLEDVPERPLPRSRIT